MAKSSTTVPKKAASSSKARSAVKKAAASSTRKTRPKKAAAKKTASKGKPAKRQLKTASNAESFWMNDGRILNDLRALAESFAAMDAIVYRYHTAAKKNDFADWVEQVLDDAACAAALRKAKTPRGAHTVVVRHLRYYA